MAAFTNTNEFVTCSDDGTVRIWSLLDRKCLGLAKTNLDKDGSLTARDKATGDFADSTKGRALAVSPDGESIVVGFKDGTLREFKVSEGGEGKVLE